MLCFADIVRTQQSTQVAYRRLKHIKSRHSTCSEVNALDCLHSGFELLVQAHNSQRVQRIDQGCTALPKAVCEASCYRSDFVLQPCVLLVPVPGVQERLFDRSLSLKPLCLGVLCFNAELMLYAGDCRGCACWQGDRRSYGVFRRNISPFYGTFDANRGSSGWQWESSIKRKLAIGKVEKGGGNAQDCNASY